MKNRIHYIDIAKFFAIFIIVLGHTIVHSLHCTFLFKFLYSFNVVLFFILSGYTFKIKNIKFVSFLSNKFFRIMIPYFVWAVLFLIPYIMFGKDVGSDLNINSNFDISTLFVNILYGNGINNALKQNTSLWFLPTLFCIEIFYYFIINYVDKNKKKCFLILLFSFLLGFVCSNYFDIILPWGLNNVLNLGFFFILGYYCNISGLFLNGKIMKLRYAILFLIIGITSCHYNSVVSWVDFSYGNYFLMLLSSVSLSFLFIYLSYIICSNQILEYIGRNTMGILIFHKLIVLLFQTKFNFLSLWLTNSDLFIELMLGILVSIFSIVISLAITYIIKKICPFVIGEKFLKKLKGVEYV